ncbi:Crp/Fnr family transcriptional regulator [soil metagenome]
MDRPVVSPDLFASLPDSLRPLAARGQIRRLAKGYRLIEEGEFGDTIFIILSGRLKVYSTDDRDREVIFGFHGPGAYLGEMSLDGGPRSASVIAMEASKCVVITRQTLRDHIASHPEFAFELLSRVIHRARLATRGLRSMALLDVYGRMVQLLTELSVPHGNDTRVIDDRPTHAELASRIGSSREMVSRLLKDLETGGYVRVDGRRLVILRMLPHRW